MSDYINNYIESNKYTLRKIIETENTENIIRCPPSLVSFAEHLIKVNAELLDRVLKCERATAYSRIHIAELTAPSDFKE